MKILFQGGWRSGRDQAASRDRIAEYCQAFGTAVAANRHQVILTGTREYDSIVAGAVAAESERRGINVKESLLYLLPDRTSATPRSGRVRRYPNTRWWIEERTFLVQESDVIVAIGGGRGTFDCVEKGFLSNKPVFVAAGIPSKASEAWKRRRAGYFYLESGDADFLDDENLSGEEFAADLFQVLNRLSETRFARRVFVVHGHDHHVRDQLASVLGRLDFEVVVLQREPSQSLTIIEKLERDTASVGFSFVLYTPDDACVREGQSPQGRARQNVVFEHGLLLGTMGRDRTCAIVIGHVELPSDLSGVIYERVNDIEGEALKIARVLSHAGYVVDAQGLL